MKFKCRSNFISNIKCIYSWTSTLSITRTYSKGNIGSRNPYDVLGLHHTCSTQDIKEAYIKLCKKLHPDAKHGDATQHKKFIELNNAYTTLVNSENRQEFDERAHNFRHYRNENSFHWRMGQTKSNPFYKSTWGHERPWYEKPWYERDGYKEYFDQQKYQNKAKGENYVKNTWVVGGCLLLISIGYVLLFSAYRVASSYYLNRADKKSRKIKEHYDNVRKKALQTEKYQQLEMLKK